MYNNNGMFLLPLLCVIKSGHALPMVFCRRTEPQAAVIYERFLILMENAKHLLGQMKTVVVVSEFG